MRAKRELLCCLALLVFGSNRVADAEPTRSFEVVRTFPVPEARQGVAVDRRHFYAVDNRSIGKYDKNSGEAVRRWKAADDDGIVHLNSGVAIDGKLYCAHSNYPAVPMASSIEVFDTETLERVESLRLPTSEGSATWVDRRNGAWWGVLANYEGRGGVPGRGPAATTLVRFDPAWAVAARYVFPDGVVARFGTRSNSGGAWGNDGLLYATGHDGGEIYVLRLPPKGPALELVEILAADIDGQGIAWDRTEPGVLYGIVKKTRTVIVLREVRAGATHTVIDATTGR